MTADDVSLRAALGPHLPYLRRYARILAGSQQSGDNFVRAALEMAVVSPDSLPDIRFPRLALFRLFHAFWNPHRAEAAADDDLPEGMPGAGREALLLTAVERFSLDETAIILGLDRAAVEAAIDEARKAIAGAIQSRVLIIEDEPIISMHLEQIVGDMGHQVVADAATRAEALEMALREEPDLVLADIQLADGSSGIEAVKDILERFDVPVVFITAYPERLLTGERPEPTFLVTKPFEPEMVIATIGQALLARQRHLSPT